MPGSTLPTQGAVGWATTLNNAIAAIVATGRTAGATGSVKPVAQFTPTADSSFEVGGNILVTAGSGLDFWLEVDWTDEGGTARSTALPFWINTTATWSAEVTKAGQFIYPAIRFRAKGGTTITAFTPTTAEGAVYTGCTYNVEATIVQIA
jgi:hypothetical protein